MIQEKLGTIGDNTRFLSDYKTFITGHLELFENAKDIKNLLLNRF